MESKFGINIIGYIKGEFGLGEAIRLLIKAIENAKIPYAVINFDIKTNHNNNDTTFETFSDDAPYSINLVLIGPLEASYILTHFKNPEIFINKYNIYYLNWESENFPKEYLENIRYYDEIWTPAKYCCDIIKKYVDVPVKVIPYPISISISNYDDEIANTFYDNTKFNFLFIFDYNSTLERKNPLNLINAFEVAFGKDDLEVCLTIKTSISKRFPKEKKMILDKIIGFKNINIVENIFEKNTLHNIIKKCDSYISLHRSEGFGLTMAEAMYFGKPIIATGYSGNTEFMNTGNSFLVDFEMCQVDSKLINYDKNTIWSNPDVKHAAKLLKLVRNNSDEIKVIARKGQETMINDFSVSKIGLEIKNRITTILETFEVNKDKNTLINLYIENSKLRNELRIVNKSKLIKYIMAIKLYIRDRKEKRIK